MWNEFIELPEQQQERIVKFATDEKKKKKIYRKETQHRTTTNSCSSDENIETFVLIENRATTTTNDSPISDRLHPQGSLHLPHHSSNISHRFSEEAEACFNRIDGNIRYTLKSMLKRHHLPSVKSIHFHFSPAMII